MVDLGGEKKKRLFFSSRRARPLVSLCLSSFFLSLSFLLSHSPFFFFFCFSLLSTIKTLEKKHRVPLVDEFLITLRSVAAAPAVREALSSRLAGGGGNDGDDDDDAAAAAAASAPPPPPLQQQRSQPPPPSRTNRRRTSSTAGGGATDEEEAAAALARGLGRMSFGGVEEEEAEEEEEEFEEFEDDDDDEEERWQQQQKQQQRQHRRRPSPAYGPLYSTDDLISPPLPPPSSNGVADASADPSWLDSRSGLAFGGTVLSAAAAPSDSPSSSPAPPRRPRLESMRGLPLDAQERGVVEGLLSAFAGALDDGDFVRPAVPSSSSSSLPSSSSSSSPAAPLDEFGNRAARLELCPGADPGVAELASRLLPLASAASDVARFAHVSRRRRAGAVAAGAGREAARVLCEWRRHVARVEHASLSTACGRGGVGGGVGSGGHARRRRAGMGLQQLSLAFSADFPAVAALLETAAAAGVAAIAMEAGRTLFLDKDQVESLATQHHITLWGITS